MATKQLIKNTNGSIHLSEDGGENWEDFGAVASASDAYDISTEEINTWQHRGNKEVLPGTISETLDVEAFYEVGNKGQLIAAYKRQAKEPVLVRYFKDINRTGLYSEFSAYVVKYETSQEVEDRVKLSVSFSVILDDKKEVNLY